MYYVFICYIWMYEEKLHFIYLTGIFSQSRKHISMKVVLLLHQPETILFGIDLRNETSLKQDSFLTLSFDIFLHPPPPPFTKSQLRPWAEESTIKRLRIWSGRLCLIWFSSLYSEGNIYFYFIVKWLWIFSILWGLAISSLRSALMHKLDKLS